MSRLAPVTCTPNDGPLCSVLIVGINYWPEESGNAPYTTGLAEYLVSRGMPVSVVTGLPYYPSWRLAPSDRLRLRRRELINGIPVYRLRTFIPSRQDAIRRTLFEAGFFANGLLPPLLQFGPNVVIGVVPSLSGAGLAAVMAKRFRVPFGLVFQDLVGGAAIQSGISGGRSVAGVARTLEGWCARRAAGVAIVSEGFREYLVNLGVAPERITHMRNWTHIGNPRYDRDEIRRELGWHRDLTVVLHAGAMALKQGLENAVHAARLAVDTSPNLRFVLMGNGNQRSALESLAAGLPNLAFHDPCSSELFPSILAAADILLLNEREGVRDMALPSKLSSYFVSGRPVVAATEPTGWTAREVHAAGAGLVVPAGDPTALIDAINRLRADPMQMAAMGAAGRRYASETLNASVILPEAEKFVRRIAGSASCAVGGSVK